MSATSSPWTDAELPTAQPLAADRACDVCVIGGGIAGLTTAYLLTEAGLSVTLLEGGERPAGGETAYTTAHLAWVLDDRFAHLASVRGADTARAAADSHRGAIDLIQSIASKENIDCEFRRVDGYLFAGEKEAEVGLEQEIKAVGELDLPHERVTTSPLPSLTGGGCLRFPDQGEFHPLKYLQGLEKAVRTRGGVIHTGTRAEKIEGGATCKVHVKGGPAVTAKAVVVATNSPFDAGLELHAKLAAYTTYAIALEVPSGAVPHALFWDTEDPYHYVRVRDTGDGPALLIVGGEDHKTGQAQDQAERWGRLGAWARKRVPAAGAVKHHWSGQVFETPDGLGLIGPAPVGKNVYVITGDSGMGLTHGTLGARLVANLIRGEADPLAGVYSPGRWMPGALRTLLGENVNLAAQYLDWFTGGDVKSADAIPPGHGAVVRRGLTKCAVYKDKEGKTTELSAVCPHMGGVVRWNPGEQTWDCPCHGSRFTAEGEVLHGPAVVGLKQK
jgi:glycine/D-amino acid oxidase-like deaminating enzyme/nitrite reductase/ring-hydroxylating ferredoxin subunit